MPCRARRPPWPCSWSTIDDADHLEAVRRIGGQVREVGDLAGADDCDRKLVRPRGRGSSIASRIGAKMSGIAASPRTEWRRSVLPDLARAEFVPCADRCAARCGALKPALAEKLNGEPTVLDTSYRSPRTAHPRSAACVRSVDHLRDRRRCAPVRTRRRSPTGDRSSARSVAWRSARRQQPVDRVPRLRTSSRSCRTAASQSTPRIAPSFGHGIIASIR